MDDDTVPCNSWLENFVEAISKYNADSVSSNYIEEDLFLKEIRIRRGFPKEVQINPDGFFGIGGNVMFKKSMFGGKFKKGRICMESIFYNLR